MSIKIYNGYRLAYGTDVFKFVTKVRDLMNPIRDAAEMAYLFDRAARNIDHADFRAEPRPARPLADALSTFVTEQFDKRRTGRTHDYDYDPHRFGMSLNRDESTGRIGVLLYTETTEMREAFEQLPEVEDYDYQNSTDRPQDVTETAWRDRLTFWESVHGGDLHRPPIEAMLSMNLRGEYDGTLMGLVRNAGNEGSVAQRTSICDTRARAKSMAHQEFINEAVRRGRDVLKSYWLFRDSEGAGHITDMIEAALTPLTMEDLLGADEPLPATVDATALAAARSAVNEMCDRVVTPEDIAKDRAEAEKKAASDAAFKAKRAAAKAKQDASNPSS